MLDFGRLSTPRGDGEVLVVPEPAALAAAAEENRRRLAVCQAPLLGSTIGQWRRQVRERVAGAASGPLIVTGHQPAFVHAGVWAKHVVAVRLARAMGGTALNLVVDNDAPRQPTLDLPSVTPDGVSIRRLSYATLPMGRAFECIERQGEAAMEAFRDALRETLGSRYERTQWQRYFSGFRYVSEPRDWVDQAVAGRKAIEDHFGVHLEDRRVSDFWCSPLLLDILQRGEAFRSAYNAALADYRRRLKVRGDQQPIPDLSERDGAIEVAVWVYRRGEARRRLFARGAGRRITLFCEASPHGRALETIGEVDLDDLATCAGMRAFVDRFPEWHFRPRALTLTLWARLLLADLFIHGIGGAKYDRITDQIMEAFYGVAPPQMACVSATLLLDLPRSGIRDEDVRRQKRAVRDLQYNPQRHVEADSAVAPLLEERRAAVEKALRLAGEERGNRAARREAFLAIRAANERVRNARPDLCERYECELASMRRMREAERAATSREYFFGLHDDASLDRLLSALPSERELGL